MPKTLFLQVYRRFLKDCHPSDPGVERVSTDHTLRLVGIGKEAHDSTAWGINLPDSTKALEKIVQAEITFFKSQGKSFEWKYYEFLDPDELPEVLLKKGFKPQNPETLMALSTAFSKPIPKGSFEIRPITTPEQVKEIAQLQQDVWGESHDWLEKNLIEELKSPDSRLHIFGAYSKQELISVGWLRHYGEISYFFGGSTRPGFQRKGAYRQLVAERLKLAKEMGSKFVVSDCSPDSERVLEKLRFEKIGMTQPFIFSAGS